VDGNDALEPLSEVEITGSGIIHELPILVWGWTAIQTTAVTLFTFRDGPTALARRRFRWRVNTADSIWLMLPRPIPFLRGLFISSDVAASEIVVFFTSVREEMLAPRRDEPASVETE
jgi:hypothetical protein